MLAAASAQAQYAPQAMVSGSTAIPKSSPLFKEWATSCNVTRGLQQIDDTSFGYASLGTDSSALGIPDGDVVSLGDSGIAIIRFDHPIKNGPGPDFAVFENGFPNTANPEEAFLELAYVEVSSDGVHYLQFKPNSLTQDTAQISSTASPSYINARQINNLAGKYIANYGTPFDLDDLRNYPGIDLNNITHVKIIDVIGTLGAHASLDSDGHRINDPFPTPFPGSGFDLDAVGVINMNSLAVHSINADAFKLFPNPAGAQIQIDLPDEMNGCDALISDLQGKMLRSATLKRGINSISLEGMSCGTYFISIKVEGTLISTKIFVHSTQ
jgi:hypothetical protein